MRHPGLIAFALALVCVVIVPPAHAQSGDFDREVRRVERLGCKEVWDDRTVRRRIKICDRVLKRSDLSVIQQAYAYHVRGMAHAVAGNLPEALSDLNAALAGNPTYGRSYYERGFVYFRLNNHNQAYADFQSAMSNGDKSSETMLATMRQTCPGLQWQGVTCVSTQSAAAPSNSPTGLSLKAQAVAPLGESFEYVCLNGYYGTLPLGCTENKHLALIYCVSKVPELSYCHLVKEPQAPLTQTAPEPPAQYIPPASSPASDPITDLQSTTTWSSNNEATLWWLGTLAVAALGAGLWVGLQKKPYGTFAEARQVAAAALPPRLRLNARLLAWVGIAWLAVMALQIAFHVVGFTEPLTFGTLFQGRSIARFAAALASILAAGMLLQERPWSLGLARTVTVGAWMAHAQPSAQIEIPFYFAYMILTVIVFNIDKWVVRMFRALSPKPLPRPANLAQAPLDPAAEIVATGPGNEHWRPWLIKTLGAGTAGPAPASGTLRFFLGLIVLIAIPAAIGVLKAIIETGNGAAIVGALAAFVVIAFPIRIFFERLRARTNVIGAKELLVGDSRRPILYLRSFGLDDKSERPFRFNNPEQVLAIRLFKYGPVIAIGRPDEPLPALGAARMYVDDTQWRQTVANVASVSQYVVWATGTSEGLKWEIAHLVKTLPPDKLILWAHPQILGLSGEKREAEWRKFLDKLGSVFPKPLPQKLGDAHFFGFGPDYTPIPFAPEPGKGRSLFGNGHSFTQSLDGVLASKGLVDLAKLRRRDTRRRITGWLFWLLIPTVLLGIVGNRPELLMAGLLVVPLFFYHMLQHRR